MFRRSIFAIILFLTLMIVFLAAGFIEGHGRQFNLFSSKTLSAPLKPGAIKGPLLQKIKSSPEEQSPVKILRDVNGQAEAITIKIDHHPLDENRASRIRRDSEEVFGTLTREIKKIVEGNRLYGYYFKIPEYALSHMTVNSIKAIQDAMDRGVLGKNKGTIDFNISHFPSWSFEEFRIPKVVFEFKDNGIGMEKEVMEKLVNREGHSTKSWVDVDKGYGIGSFGQGLKHSLSYPYKIWNPPESLNIPGQLIYPPFRSLLTTFEIESSTETGAYWMEISSNKETGRWGKMKKTPASLGTSIKIIIGPPVLRVPDSLMKSA